MQILKSCVKIVDLAIRKGKLNMMMIWGKEKEVMDILEDARIHPLVTRDVIVKRIKRGWIPEIAVTRGVADETKAGDTKVRKAAREEKMEQRIKMFLLAQEVRRKHNAGVEIPDLQHRYQLSKSQVEKFISKNEYYNIFWDGNNVPEEYKEIVNKIKEKRLVNETGGSDD